MNSCCLHTHLLVVFFFSCRNMKISWLSITLLSGAEYHNFTVAFAVWQAMGNKHGEEDYTLAEKKRIMLLITIVDKLCWVFMNLSHVGETLSKQLNYREPKGNEWVQQTWLAVQRCVLNLLCCALLAASASELCHYYSKRGKLQWLGWRYHSILKEVVFWG